VPAWGDVDPGRASLRSPLGGPASQWCDRPQPQPVPGGFTLRRTLLVLAAMATVLLGTTAPALAAASPTATCVSAANATYRHTFNGAAGTATITAVRPLCDAQTFSLASYTAPAESLPGGLFRYAATRATINKSHRSVTLKVAVPACSAQVSAYFGSSVTTETTSAAPLYGTSRLGSGTGAGSRSVGKFAYYATTSTACTAAPAVSFASSCNAFTATLTNSSSANTDAVFLRNGTPIRVAPGRTAKVTTGRGSTLHLRSSSFTTYIGEWRQPSTNCIAPVAPVRPTASTAPAAAVRPSSPSARPAASPSSSAVAEPVVPGPMIAKTRSTPAPAATASNAGISPGSMLAILCGLALIAGGATLLTRVIRSARRLA
jgi:hypothetical protein